MFPSTFDGEKKSARNFYQDRLGTNKHRETSNKRERPVAVLQGATDVDDSSEVEDGDHSGGAGNRHFCAMLYSNSSFTKTGSGQT
jgi:hypothetical protein